MLNRITVCMWNKTRGKNITKNNYSSVCNIISRSWFNYSLRLNHSRKRDDNESFVPTILSFPTKMHKSDSFIRCFLHYQLIINHNREYYAWHILLDRSTWIFGTRYLACDENIAQVNPIIIFNKSLTVH